MATTSTGVTNFAGLVNVAVQAELEANLRANTIFFNGADPYIHQFGTSVMRRAQITDIVYSSNSAALTEGTQPTPIALAISYDGITAHQEGVVLSITDLLQFSSPYNMAKVMTDKCQRFAAESIDSNIRTTIDTYATSSVVIYSGTSTSRATVSAKVNGAYVKNLIGRLRQANVSPFSDGLYRIAMSPRAIIDLQADSAAGSFTDVLKYTSPDPLLKGEVGIFAGARILDTTICTTYATAGNGGVDVVRCYAWGVGAVGVGDTSTVAFYYVPAGGDHSDALGQQTLAGVKLWIGATVQTAAGARILVGETAATPLAVGQV